MGTINVAWWTLENRFDTGHYRIVTGPRNKTGVTVTDFLFERRRHAPVTLAGQAR